MLVHEGFSPKKSPPDRTSDLPENAQLFSLVGRLQTIEARAATRRVGNREGQTVTRDH